MWRQGDQTAEPKIYRTTTVNFGDKPAGCISIAAARETADMFGNNSQSAWFLKNRTYVDDNVSGANSLEELEKVSQELEQIVQAGGFKFKETFKSGYLLVQRYLDLIVAHNAL